MHLFYLPHIDEDHAALPDEEAKHALRVLRLKNGDEVKVTNGTGIMYRARIEELSQKKCALVIISREVVPSPSPVLHLAISPTKNTDRLEWLLEKATEIGIQVFTPLLCDHSERRVQKTDRLLKIAIAALKQSQQAWMPEIREAVSFKDFIREQRTGQKFIAHCREGHRRPLQNSYSPGQDAVIMIGPEGDFSEKETEAAIQEGFQPVSLGEKRLRTETAGLVALHTLVLLNQ
jgi:16S rRNA (uracil1498-N3)-methyltransferase